VRIVRGEVLADNERMRHLLSEVGATSGAVDSDTFTFDVALPDPAETIAKERSHPLRRLLRAVARGG
jgi:hypothetical protein